MSGLGVNPAAALYREIRQTPYGQGGDDVAFQRAFNASDETVIVRVRNLSALRKRRVPIDHIGLGRGGERYLEMMNAKGRQVNLDALYRDFASPQGRDVTPTEDRLEPVDVVLTWDSKQYLVPAKDEKGHLAPWVDVPEGVFDLYFGNAKRLADPAQMAQELNAVRSRRRDFCVRRLVEIKDAEKAKETSGDRDNPWAFLVFYREVVQPATAAIDREKIFAGELMEV